MEPERLSQYPLGRVRIACDQCRREGSWSVARLAERFGAEMDLHELLRALTSSCKWQRPPGAREPRQYQPRCLAYYPDLYPPPGRPKLRVVRG